MALIVRFEDYPVGGLATELGRERSRPVDRCQRLHTGHGTDLCSTLV